MSDSDSERMEAAARAIIERLQRSDVTNTCPTDRQWDEARIIANVVLRAADGVRQQTATTEPSPCPECGFLNYSSEGRAVFDADINAEHMAERSEGTH